MCALMSIGITLGLKANDVQNPVDIKFSDFVTLMGISFISSAFLSSVLVVLLREDSSDVSIIIASFFSSGIAASFKVVRKFIGLLHTEREIRSRSVVSKV